MRIGLLGGTFNPPHIGHLLCAQSALEECELDHVIFVPTGQPPHKRVAGGLSADQRVQLTELAVAGNERFSVSRVDVDRAGPSWTVDTLRALHAERPDDELIFIVGGDMAHSLPTWRDPAWILELAELAVAEREGVRRADIEERLQPLNPEGRVRFFDMPRVDVSSSLVRTLAAAGRSVRYLVPDAVVEHIAGTGLYRATTEVA